MGGIFYAVIGFVNMLLAFKSAIEGDNTGIVMGAIGCVYWSLMSIRQAIADKKMWREV